MNRPDSPTGTILLVDDERRERVAFRRLLERQGHTVVEADSGEAAIGRAAGQDRS